MIVYVAFLLRGVSHAGSLLKKVTLQKRSFVKNDVVYKCERVFIAEHD